MPFENDILNNLNTGLGNLVGLLLDIDIETQMSQWVINGGFAKIEFYWQSRAEMTKDYESPLTYVVCIQQRQWTCEYDSRSFTPKF